MTAPGLNLEFGEGAGFKARIKSFPELGGRILQHLRSWPNSGIEVVGSLRMFEISEGGGRYAVIYRRQGNRIGLIGVFEVPAQKKLLAEALAELKNFYGGK